MSVNLLRERFAILRDQEARLGPACPTALQMYRILPYHRRDCSRVTAALISDVGVLSIKSLDLSSHCYYRAELLLLYLSPQRKCSRRYHAGRCDPRHSQMNSTCGPVRSLPATTWYSIQSWWGVISKQTNCRPEKRIIAQPDPSRNTPRGLSRSLYLFSLLPYSLFP